MQLKSLVNYNVSSNKKDIAENLTVSKDNAIFTKIHFYKLVWLFILGSIIGFIVETLWCIFRNGYIENRQGLIYGPFIPVYGFGAILFALFLYKLKDLNCVLIFVLCSILGAAFEYLCSWFQESILGTISWEYSNSPFNFHGRTNLMYAACWGLLGVGFIRYIYPKFSILIDDIPKYIISWLTLLMVIFMVFDLFISAVAVKRESQRDYDIPANNQFTSFLDVHYADDYLAKIYTNMQIV